VRRPRTGSPGTEPPSARPNILLITTDQQHHRLAGYAGDRFVRTPALDRLAREGTRFELTYAANPVCVPSRYSMLTGHLPHRFGGLETNQQSNGQPLPAIADWVSSPPMGRCLQAAGYDTVYGGKLHVEGVPAFTPAVEERFGFRCLTGDARDDLAQRSRGFLLNRARESAAARSPFFLWASFINPHDICHVLPRGDDRPSFAPATLDESPPLPDNVAPTRGEPRWISGFRDGTLGDESTVELGLNRRFGRSARSWSERQWRLYRGFYRHHMADVDRQVGIVLDALRESGLERDTVVIFTSDHGDHDGEHRLTMKRSFYEAAAHVPLLVRWPGRVPAGHVDAGHLINNGIDLLPTLCDLAGAAPPAGLPGRSFAGLAQTEAAAKWREFTVSETVAGRMLRSARYKYCVYHHAGASEELLCDLHDDPLETVNLAASPPHRATLHEHRHLLAEWTRHHQDPAGTTYLAAL
jgi:choline-sulfatase